MPTRLLSDDDLERSSVVANCRMNRERELTGTNGYDRELRLHPLTFLRERLASCQRVRWLDLCCGTGRALFQAADLAEMGGWADRISITGVDLVTAFWPGRPSPCLRLEVASVHAWEPPERFDLITCVHGLHYLGDKLALITRAAGWLVQDGLLVANLDLANLRGEEGQRLARTAGRLFRRAKLDYHPRQRLLSCRGRREVSFPLVYLGADDDAGPNYTGQPAVHSRYRDGTMSL